MLDNNEYLGLSEKEISFLSERKKKEIREDGAYYLFLRMFGKTKYVKYLKMLVYLTDFRVLEAEEEEEKLFIEKHGEEFIPWDKLILLQLKKNEKYTDCKISDIMIIHESLDVGILIFTLLKEKDFNLFTYNKDEDSLFWPHSSITAHFRNRIFYSFKNSNQKKLRKKQILNDTLNSIPWIMYYNKIAVQYFGYSIREKFIRKIEVKEITENFFYSIDEVEKEFIKHLIEEHGAPYLPEIYDPYTDTRTFYDYL